MSSAATSTGAQPTKRPEAAIRADHVALQLHRSIAARPRLPLAHDQRAALDEGEALPSLDPRIHQRWYGRVFVESLPPVRIEAGPLDDLLDAVTPLLR